ncbi:MAG TPA: DinB family protein [Thermomicrobiales bacterium]|nr:DinB family protein [Thermomicrobiales bacterium]
MFASAVRTFYAYNAWANARVLDAAEWLDPEQLLADRAGGYGSIRDTLVHIVDAEWMYLERWRGRSPDATRDPAAFPDVASIRAHSTAVAAETRGFVDGLGDADLGRVVSYVNVLGETWAYPLWQQLLHQINHATQHRSEAAVRLTQLGHSPGWLDFLIFIDE